MWCNHGEELRQEWHRHANAICRWKMSTNNTLYVTYLVFHTMVITTLVWLFRFSNHWFRKEIHSSNMTIFRNQLWQSSCSVDYLYKYKRSTFLCPYFLVYSSEKNQWKYATLKHNFRPPWHCSDWHNGNRINWDGFWHGIFGMRDVG